MSGKQLGFGGTFKIVAFVCISLVVIASISIGVWWGFTGNVPKLSSNGISVNNYPSQSTIANAQYPLSQCDWSLLVLNQVNSPLTTATVNIYVTGSYASTYATGTTDGSTGILLTGPLFTSGQSYTIEIKKTGVDYWTTLTVPNGVSITSTVAYSYINAFSAGTYSMPITDSLTTHSYTTGDTWNVTTGGHPGASIATMQVNVRNTATGTGFIPSTNPIYGVTYGAVLQIALSATNYSSVSITAPANAVYQWSGTTRYWYIPLTASDFTVTTLAGIQSGGTSNEGTFTIDTSGNVGTTGGSTICTLTATMYLYTSVPYEQAHGTWGANALAAATSTITITG